jgi:hypothetical protein
MNLDDSIRALTDQFYEELVDVVGLYYEALPLSTVVGMLEILKQHLILDNVEFCTDDDDEGEEE